MKFKEFIDSIQELLELKKFKKANKEKSIKKLLEKLVARKKVITDSLENTKDEKEEIALTEELEIISKQIKKGKKLLKSLKSKEQE